MLNKLKKQEYLRCHNTGRRIRVGDKVSCRGSDKPTFRVVGFSKIDDRSFRIHMRVISGRDEGDLPLSFYKEREVFIHDYDLNSIYDRGNRSYFLIVINEDPFNPQEWNR